MWIFFFFHVHFCGKFLSIWWVINQSYYFSDTLARCILYCILCIFSMAAVVWGCASWRRRYSSIIFFFFFRILPRNQWHCLECTLDCNQYFHNIAALSARHSWVVRVCFTWTKGLFSLQRSSLNGKKMF